MRGWIALTRNWERPINPEFIPKVVPLKRGRPRALSDEQRKQLYDMDLLIRETRDEMAAIFKRAGLNHDQAIYQMCRIRRGKP